MKNESLGEYASVKSTRDQDSNSLCYPSLFNVHEIVSSRPTRKHKKEEKEQHESCSHPFWSISLLNPSDRGTKSYVNVRTSLFIRPSPSRRGIRFSLHRRPYLPERANQENEEWHTILKGLQSTEEARMNGSEIAIRSK